MSQSSITTTTTNMFVHLDAATTDCLQSFQDSVGNAQRDLANEQERLRALERTLADAKRINDARTQEKRHADMRLEALASECARVKAANLQHMAELDAVTAHVDVLRRPRAAANAVTAATEAANADRRGAYVDAAHAFLSNALDALAPDQCPSSLNQKLEGLLGELGAAQRRVSLLLGRAPPAHTMPPVATTIAEDPNARMSAAQEEAAQRHGLDAALHDIAAREAAMRSEHTAAVRQLTTQRDAMRDTIRMLTSKSEAAEQHTQEAQHAYNIAANEAGASLCSVCNGPLCAMDGTSGHD